MTLLEKAMKVKPTGTSTSIDAGELELYLAFLNGQISRAQMCAALGKTNNPGNVMYRLANTIREAVLRREISITRALAHGQHATASRGLEQRKTA